MDTMAVVPLTTAPRAVRLIKRESLARAPASLPHWLKINQLVNQTLIDLLYEAWRAV